MTDSSRRSTFQRLATVAALAVLYSGLGTATYHTGGSLTRFFNSYFLPAGSQVSGVSEILFGVIAPFGIVLVILHAGLDMLDVFDRRQSAALATLISLFIIPSGGYKVISGFFLTLFSLGGGGVSAPSSVPFVDVLGVPVTGAIVSFFLFAILINRVVTKSDKQFGSYEYLSSAGGAFLVYMGLQGGVGFIVMGAGYLAILWFGYQVFKRGTGTGGYIGLVIAMIGIYLLTFIISGLEILPANIQSAAGTIETYIFAGMIVSVFVVAAVFALAFLGKI